MCALWRRIRARTSQLPDVYPIMVFMDPGTIVQSAANQAASTICFFILISAVIIGAKLAFGPASTIRAF
jgi:hypothetical protein